jgi:hypothetical protein
VVKSFKTQCLTGWSFDRSTSNAGVIPRYPALFFALNGVIAASKSIHFGFHLELVERTDQTYVATGFATSGLIHDSQIAARLTRKYGFSVSVCNLADASTEHHCTATVSVAAIEKTRAAKTTGIKTSLYLLTFTSAVRYGESDTRKHRSVRTF